MGSSASIFCRLGRSMFRPILTVSLRSSIRGRPWGSPYRLVRHYCYLIDSRSRRLTSSGNRPVWCRWGRSCSREPHRDALVCPAEPLEAHADHEQEVDGAGDRDPGERGSPRIAADPLPGTAHDEVDR